MYGSQKRPWKLRIISEEAWAKVFEEVYNNYSNTSTRETITIS